MPPTASALAREFRPFLAALRLPAVRLVSAVLACVFVAATPSRAHADGPPPPTKQGSYSQYEKETIAIALETFHAELDPEPEGKTLEAVEVLPLEVFEQRDPVPRIANVIHATTRPYVISREVLLARGEPYQQVMVDETARNLRQLPQLSLVIPLAVRGTSPDKVRLLIVTKDVWSLRLAWDIAAGGGGLERLRIQPSETNLAGTHQTISALFNYLPLSSSVGLGYVEPRLAGTRLAFATNANVVLNNRSGKPEGSYGSMAIARPLFSAKEEWAYGTSTAWSDQMVRRYVDARLAAFKANDLPAPNNTTPYQYRGRLVTEYANVTRSFGWTLKNDFTFGAELNKREYLLEDVAASNPQVVAEFVQKVLPVSDTRAAPYVQWRTYRTEFLRVLDMETLGLQEDHRVGHDIWLRAYPVTRALGSSRDFMGIYAAALYTLPIGDGLVRGGVESTTEAQSSSLSDASVTGSLRFVSPSTGLGRLVVDGFVLNRYRNYLNRVSYLGGDTRLRGYPSTFLEGKDVMSYNVELRSRAIEILSTIQGLVLFYDAGNALNGLDHLFDTRNSLDGIHHTTGLGWRILFPQLDRIVFRADVGFPVGPRPAGVAPAAFFITFGQAFPLPSVGAPAASPGATTALAGALGQ